MNKDERSILDVSGSAEFSEPRELFCKDFDLGCFEMADPAGCKRGKSAVIQRIYYYTDPVKAVCPICDQLR